MAHISETHRYSDRSSFTRLLLLIATFVRYPGIGSADPLGKTAPEHHQALQQVQTGLQQVAQDLGFSLPDYGIATLQKDLKVLRDHGILHQRMYRWGYFLGTGVLTLDEFPILLQALASQAKFQGDSQARHIYDTLMRRLKGLNLDEQGKLFYPVRTQLNRVAVHTDPDEMMRRRENRHTLFHHLPAIEQAIIHGQCIELYRYRDPFGTQGIGKLRVYPLQLIYSDLAWYLLYDYSDAPYLEIERVDRFSDQCSVLAEPLRSLEQQRDRLAQAHQLLQTGWGLYLGTREAQQQELDGTLPRTLAWVRFFPPVAAFILETEQRHPQQQMQIVTHAEGDWVDYKLELPERSLNEFRRWVSRFMDAAIFIAPETLAARHRQSAAALLQRYQHDGNNRDPSDTG